MVVSKSGGFMDNRTAFGNSLRMARKANNLSQEDFSDVSSRTYLSSLERGLKNPTLDKVQALAERINIHPLTLLTLTYLYKANETDASIMFNQVKIEVDNILQNKQP
jgi:transcriptional regulator with XRE-family HTH domain